MICDRVYELKTIRTTFLMLVILKNYDYLNQLQGGGLCRVKQIGIRNNYCEYINSYFITPRLIKINPTSSRVPGWGE